MKRPTIALCAILKNEMKNLPRFMRSVEDCFDEIHFTDTGSTDGSIEWIKDLAHSDARVKLHHFEWCNDFAAARNASFAPATADYVMWLDLDDVLGNRDAFIAWRDEVMGLADYWMNSYHYALNEKNDPVCSFARERVVKRNLGFEWKYFVHEGIMPVSPVKKNLTIQYALTWSVIHKRDNEDVKQDRNRNLALFEANKHRLDSRMRYYYGKELFENGKAIEAFPELVRVIAEPDLEAHDRIMGIQYAVMSAMALNQFDKAIQLAFQGLHLSPQRAEFFVAIGDSHLKLNRIMDSVPYFEAATRCQFVASSPVQGPIYQNQDCYRHYPLLQLARIFFNTGDPDRAETFVDKARELGETEETKHLKGELQKFHQIAKPRSNRIQTDEIIITCPPQALYPWDHNVYAEKGIGGSETAAVEMATWLSRITGKKVIIFNPREKPATFAKVEYRPVTVLPEYLRDYKPALHIAWRHALKISDDPMYVWSHDLGCQGLEQYAAYEKVLALSPFHKNYIKNFFGVPEEKILVTRNGIEPVRFTSPVKRSKEYGKVVYSSSPDRGLDRAILVMDEVVKSVPQAKLHVYYGFDNMEKMGMGAEITRLKAMMASRPHVVFHGNIPQDKLTDELETACVWLYPTNFLETYCITAIEMLCSGVYPVVREHGALQDTLYTAGQIGMASVLPVEGETEEERKLYAAEVIRAIKEKLWAGVIVDPQQFSWKSVAEEWADLFNLRPECHKLPRSNSSQGRMV